MKSSDPLENTCSLRFPLKESNSIPSRKERKSISTEPSFYPSIASSIPASQPPSELAEVEEEHPEASEEAEEEHLEASEAEEEALREDSEEAEELPEEEEAGKSIKTYLIDYFMIFVC